MPAGSAAQGYEEAGPFCRECSICTRGPSYAAGCSCLLAKCSASGRVLLCILHHCNAMKGMAGNN